ncbi:MAG: homoserine kinase [Myxococcales bacterium]|nr:homoserine kinase [Myxococcales bacterium]
MAIRTPLTPEDVAPCLSAIGHDARSVTLEPVHAGTVNTSYVARLASGARVFLRLYEQQDPSGAAREAALLGRLAARDVPTPGPLVRADGAYVTLVHGKALVAFPFLEGETTCQAGVTPTKLRAVGTALARLHLAVDGVPAPRGRFEREDLLRLVSTFGVHPSCSVRETAPFLARELSRDDGPAARDPSLPGGLVHGDLFRDNVLFRGDELAALLDFESACEGTFVYDLAVVFLSWCYGASFDWDLARALVAGYEVVRPLERREWNAFFAEARFGCLRFATTRIADDTIRVGKHYRRFLARLTALEAVGPSGLAERLRA